MLMARIHWREAVRRFRVLRCRGCHVEDNGQDWFVEQGSMPLNGPYCSDCVIRLKTGTDSTRSKTQFFANTRGTRTRQ